MPELAQVAAMHDSGQPQMLFKMHHLPCCTGYVQPHLTLSSKTPPMLIGAKISPQKSAKVHHPTLLGHLSEKTELFEFLKFDTI
jgi:hypothetical protein